MDWMGGVGYTRDYPIEKYYRDCKVGMLSFFTYFKFLFGESEGKSAVVPSNSFRVV